MPKSSLAIIVALSLAAPAAAMAASQPRLTLDAAQQATQHYEERLFARSPGRDREMYREYVAFHGCQSRGDVVVCRYTWPLESELEGHSTIVTCHEQLAVRQRARTLVVYYAAGVRCY